jgi:hypothetical protein
VARKYATGTYAWFICQRCGLRGLYRDSVFDGHIANLRVHPECWEPKHPQESLPKVTDPVALWRPSPEWGGTPPVLEGQVIEDGEDTPPILVIASQPGDINLEWSAAVYASAEPVLQYDIFRINSFDYNGNNNFGGDVLTVDDFAAGFLTTVDGSIEEYADSDFPLSPSNYQYAYYIQAFSDPSEEQLDSNIVYSQTPS